MDGFCDTKSAAAKGGWICSTGRLIRGLTSRTIAGSSELQHGLGTSTLRDADAKGGLAARRVLGFLRSLISTSPTPVSYLGSTGSASPEGAAVLRGTTLPEAASPTSEAVGTASRRALDSLRSLRAPFSPDDP